MEDIRRNMGALPKEDYLEILAMQNGFSSYKEMSEEEISVAPETEKLTIRSFTHEDLEAVEEMDELSGNDVSQWVKDLEGEDFNDEVKLESPDSVGRGKRFVK